MATPSPPFCSLPDILKASLHASGDLVKSCDSVQALVSRLFQPVTFDVATSPSSCGEREVCKELTDVLKSNSVFSCAFSPASGPPWCVLAPLPVPPPTPSESSNHTLIIVAVACGVVVVVAVVAAVVYVKQKARHRKLSTLPMHEDSECCDEGYVAAPGGTALASKRPVPASAYVRPPCATFSDQLNLYDLESFRLPYDHIVLQKPLAQGAFGDVWLGHLLNQRVAVKTLKVANVAQDVQLFIWEILLLSKLDCPYVVHFLGVAWNESPSRMMLVTEFMDGGDLRSVLDASRTSRRFSWLHKMECALHIAEGLVYLHSLDTKVIHRDLKSRNVMLDSVSGAKITDFGVARETNDATMTVGIGTYRWMAPEVLTDGHYTEKADMFSFGVILAELSTELVPYTDLSLSDAGIIARVMVGTLRPTFDTTESPPWFVEMGTQCLALQADQRPTAAAVAYALRQALKQTAETIVV